MRAVIIGAGIGGLAAAVALRRIGIEPLVIEHAACIREVGAGLSIWSNAVNALRELDLEARVMASASVIERNLVQTPAGSLIAQNELSAVSRRPGRLASVYIEQFCKNCCSIRCRQLRYESVRAAPASTVRPRYWRAANVSRPMFLWEPTVFPP
jgi:hypothetical protein